MPLGSTPDRDNGPGRWVELLDQVPSRWQGHSVVVTLTGSDASAVSVVLSAVLVVSAGTTRMGGQRRHGLHGARRRHTRARPPVRPTARSGCRPFSTTTARWYSRVEVPAVCHGRLGHRPRERYAAARFRRPHLPASRPPRSRCSRCQAARSDEPVSRPPRSRREKSPRCRTSGPPSLRPPGVPALVSDDAGAEVGGRMLGEAALPARPRPTPHPRSGQRRPSAAASPRTRPIVNTAPLAYGTGKGPRGFPMRYVPR